MSSRQSHLSEIKKEKQRELDGKSKTHVMNTTIDGTNFVHTIQAAAQGPALASFTVPSKIEPKTDIKLTVGTKKGVPAADFFDSIGCLEKPARMIDMLQLNKVKQYLDMIKDGTSSNLLKKLNVFSFTSNQSVIQNITYPNTLDAIKEYFNEHYKREGKTSYIFWPRHGEYTKYASNKEVAFHDCGFKPELSIVKGPPDEIDPLAHGPFNPNVDIIYPKVGETITWSSETLEAVGYPRGCSITAKNNGMAGKSIDWEIEVICCNEANNLKVKVNNRGIFKNGSEVPISMKGVKTIKDMKQGNAFKTYIQKESSGAMNDDVKLILLGLILIKSFGDNSFDLSQRDLHMLGFPTTVFTCDFTLYLSTITSGMGSGAVLTTNSRQSADGPTGNLSTRFSPRELTPEEELSAIYESCKFENNQYLTMLKNQYNDIRQRPSASSTGNTEIEIKIGGQNKKINLWFLVTIIETVNGNIANHKQIYDKFLAISGRLSPEEWKNNKEKILQLLKCYCKIVFPFVKKNGIWTILAQADVTSKPPATTTATQVVKQYFDECNAFFVTNKEMMKTRIDACLGKFNEKTGKVVSVGKINMQQWALLIEKYFKPSDVMALKDLDSEVSVSPEPAVDVVETSGMMQEEAESHEPATVTSVGDRQLPPIDVTNSSVSPPRPTPTSTTTTPIFEQLKFGGIGEKRTLAQEEEEEEQRRYQEELNAEVNAKLKAEQLFDAEGLKVFVDSIFTRPIELTTNEIVEAGFPPKALYNIPSDDFVSEIRKNFNLLFLVHFSSCLSQLLKLISTKLTSGHGDVGEMKTQQELYDSMVSGITELTKKARDEHVKFLSKEKTVVEEILDKVNQNIQGREDIDNLTLACLYANIETANEEIKSLLLSVDIIPSIETFEYVVSRLNFDIFYKCVTNYRDYNEFYKQLQDEPRYHEYFPEIHRISDESLSFYEQLYDNIKNIAYNVFYNHEYLLPFECYNFDDMVAHLIEQSDIDIIEPVPEEAGQTVSNPYNDLTEASQSLSQSLSQSMSDDSQPALEFGTPPRGENKPVIPVSVFKPKKLNRDMDGGGSTRRRRNLKRRTKQPTQKRGRRASTKNQERRSIKHRKSQMKHKDTVKRRKNKE